MKDEQIAREIVHKWLREVAPIAVQMSVLPRHTNPLLSAIATALATARREGFDACKEQAAEVAERQAREWGVYRDHWPQRDACGDVAEAIRALEPNHD